MRRSVGHFSCVLLIAEHPLGMVRPTRLQLDTPFRPSILRTLQERLIRTTRIVSSLNQRRDDGHFGGQLGLAHFAGHVLAHAV